MRRLFLAGLLAAVVCALPQPGHAEPRWWKGNLHTHSFWSDGDDFPEMVCGWYQDHGYHFLALSDHNVLQEGQRWLAIGTNELRQEALEKYLQRFGTNWVELRGKDGHHEVRLKPLTEYRARLERSGEFLLIKSEEISDHFLDLPVHMGAGNVRNHIAPQGGHSVRETIQNNFNAIRQQARATGQPMLPHLAHPNFGWGVTAEDIAAVQGEKFFEVYNGHPSVHNAGDAEHASTDRIWDIAQTLRRKQKHPEPLYALAVDDTHNYHRQGIRFSNAGRGWIMVRAEYLTPECLLQAMERGDFYASTGVQLKDIQHNAEQLWLEIAAVDGVTYRTEFMGTRRGFDAASEPVRDKEGAELSVTRRYSAGVGEVLAVVDGHRPAYPFQGNELYVRARVTASRAAENPTVAGDREMAWTQPVFFESPKAK